MSLYFACPMCSNSEYFQRGGTEIRFAYVEAYRKRYTVTANNICGDKNLDEGGMMGLMSWLIFSLIILIVCAISELFDDYMERKRNEEYRKK